MTFSILFANAVSFLMAAAACHICCLAGEIYRESVKDSRAKKNLLFRLFRAYIIVSISILIPQII